MPSLDEIKSLREKQAKLQSFKDETLLKLLHKGTEFLYKLPEKHTTFVIKSKNGFMSCIGKHYWKIKEHRFGKAMMITKICEFCYFGEVEVFPPKQNRMVINH